MMKKIWLVSLIISTFLLVWATFADIITPGTHNVDVCVKLENVEIDNYRVVVENFGPMTDRIYEPEVWKCLYGYYKFWKSRQYLLDKSINIEEITHENIKDKAILIWEWIPEVNWETLLDANPLKKWTIIYAIVKDWDSYTLKKRRARRSVLDWWDLFEIAPLKIDVINRKTGEKIGTSRNEDFIRDSGVLIKFLIAWILTILIETIVLFLIAKLFRRGSQISTPRIFLVGFAASTITLPLLRFVLPLFIYHGVEYTLIWEPLAIFLETFILKYWLKISWKRAIMASIVCNIVSYAMWFYIF